MELRSIIKCVSFCIISDSLFMYKHNILNGMYKFFHLIDNNGLFLNIWESLQKLEKQSWSQLGAINNMLGCTFSPQGFYWWHITYAIRSGTTPRKNLKTALMQRANNKQKCQPITDMLTNYSFTYLQRDENQYRLIQTNKTTDISVWRIKLT